MGKVYQFEDLKKIVEEYFGDALRNLGPKRKKKIIERGVLIWIKANNIAVNEISKEIENPRIFNSET